ncbi:MAG: protein kinase [Gemmatimonadetes bacterium]|nr:protein kinase [Gemmatimonadota bacterium]
MTIPNDRWPRLSALFDEALDLPESARAAWLAEAAPDDPTLRQELVRMLAAHARTGPLDRNLAPLAEADFHGRLDAALGDRYALGKTLGVGGTAAVFLAHESKHDRHVVLKVLQPGLAAAIGPTRFLEEVRITARLSHPHILPLLDSGEVDGLLFYVMPYLGGETLRERLARDGALPLTEAVGLLRDIAGALAHAHAAGVIHRDLKPENVLSVGAHAYLLDFGIAKLEADVESASVTHPGFAIGTPGYMAPEQAAGQAVDHRADLYSWGLLAREILTGARSALPLGEQRPDLPRSLVALVEACLAIDPAERPATASSLVAALDGLVAPVQERPWSRLLLPILAVAAVVAAMLMMRGEAPAAAPIAGPIAVTPLRNETGDSALAGWGRLAGDWVTQGLHEAGLLTVVPWPSILLAAEQHAKSGAADLAATVREETGAALVVSGGYYRTGDSLRFQVSITDMRDGRLVAAIPPVVVVKDSAASAVRELRDRVMGALAVALDERMPPEVDLAAHPPTWEAYRAFDRGMAEFNRYDYAKADTSLREAWALDSTFVPALLYATFAVVNDGDAVRGDSLLAQVMLRQRHLSGYHAALAGYLEAYLAGDRSQALPKILLAAGLAPSSRAGYNAAFVLLQLNRPREADSILGSLNPDRGPMRDWPTYWSQRAYAAHLLGDHDRERSYARTMRARHPDQRVSWVIEARALAAMGREQALDSLFVAAATLDPDVYWSQGAMYVVAGEELAAHQRGDSLVRFRQAVTWFEERLRNDPANRAHQTWLAQAYLGLGDWKAAERWLSIVDAKGPPRLFIRGLLATLAARRGDSAGAVRLLGPGPTAGHVDGEFLVYEARLAALRGDREEAIAKLSTALRLGVNNFHWVQHAVRQDFAAMAGDARYRKLMGLEGGR